MKTPPDLDSVVPPGTVTLARLHGALAAVDAYDSLRRMHRQRGPRSIDVVFDNPRDDSDGRGAAYVLIARVGRRTAKRRIVRIERWIRSCRRKAKDRRDDVAARVEHYLAAEARLCARRTS